MSDRVAPSSKSGWQRFAVGVRLVGGLVLMVLLGTALLMLPVSASGTPLRADQALFTAVSALTVTGLSVITPSADLSFVGQCILLVLIQLGGVGYMVLAVTAFRLIGRRISLADRLALRDSLGLISPEGVLNLSRYIVWTVLAIEAVGALLLYFHWDGVVSNDRRAFYAIFHSVSSFCNAGFDLFSGQPEHLTGIPRDNGTFAILGGLIFIGGLGIPVLFDFVSWPKRRTITLHTRITVPLSLTLLVLGAAALWASERAHFARMDMSGWQQFGASIFQSIACRTAGYAGFEEFAQMTGASQVVMISLMFIGCAPASMGGGITTGTLAVLVLALYAYLVGRDTPMIHGRAIPGEMVRKGAAVLTVSLLIVFLCTWLIAVTHNVGMNVAMFEVVSAFATCGLSLDFTTQLNGFGQAVIMFVMFWGRLGALTLVVALAGHQRPRRIRYPEEKILIG